MFGNLRLVATEKLNEYRANTELFLKLGNEAFAASVREGRARAVSNPYHAPWLLYHSWRQQRIQLDDGTAGLIRELMEGRPVELRHQPVVAKLRELGWCDGGQPADLDELVKRTRDYFLAIQNDHELRQFLGMVQRLRPKTVVEIGTARGGMLFCFSQLAERDATLVSIDLPGAPNCGGQTAVEREVFATFGPPTQQFHFIPADSHLEATRKELAALLRGQTIDLLFIDGDHSHAGCLADFHDYHDLVDPDGLIVFHDICLFPDEWPGAGVGLVWQELKARYAGVEIIDPDGVSTANVEPGQTRRWGIGVLEARRVRSPR